MLRVLPDPGTHLPLKCTYPASRRTAECPSSVPPPSPQRGLRGPREKLHPAREMVNPEGGW